ncbi:Uncharacterised protein [Escherichia coli]|nr:Uncharacterised protein [Escherichia coli]
MEVYSRMPTLDMTATLAEPSLITRYISFNEHPPRNINYSEQYKL